MYLPNHRQLSILQYGLLPILIITLTLELTLAPPALCYLPSAMTPPFTGAVTALLTVVLIIAAWLFSPVRTFHNACNRGVALLLPLSYILFNYQALACATSLTAAINYFGAAVWVVVVGGIWMYGWTRPWLALGWGILISGITAIILLFVVDTHFGWALLANTKSIPNFVWLLAFNIVLTMLTWGYVITCPPSADDKPDDAYALAYQIKKQTESDFKAQFELDDKGGQLFYIRVDHVQDYQRVLRNPDVIMELLDGLYTCVKDYVKPKNEYALWRYYEGESYLLYLPATKATDGDTFAEELRQHIDTHAFGDKQEYHLTVSIGRASASKQTHYHDPIRRSRGLCAEASKQGGNRALSSYPSPPAK